MRRDRTAAVAGSVLLIAAWILSRSCGAPSDPPGGKVIEVGQAAPVTHSAQSRAGSIAPESDHTQPTPETIAQWAGGNFDLNCVVDGVQEDDELTGRLEEALDLDSVGFFDAAPDLEVQWGGAERRKRPVPIRIVDGRLIAHGLPPMGSRKLVIDDHLPATVTWMTATLKPGPAACAGSILVTRTQVVRGWVRSASGTGVPGVTVTGCGSRATSGHDGEFELRLDRASSTCKLIAKRTDGAFAAIDAVPIELEADGAKDVVLVISDGPIGGMGIGIEADPDSKAIRVTRIMEGSPAQRPGLSAGDLILAVGGVSTEGMDAAEFVALGTGPVGTDVTVKVEHNGRVTTTTLSRWAAPADQQPQP